MFILLSSNLSFEIFRPSLTKNNSPYLFLDFFEEFSYSTAIEYLIDPCWMFMDWISILSSNIVFILSSLLPQPKRIMFSTYRRNFQCMIECDFYYLAILLPIIIISKEIYYTWPSLMLWASTWMFDLLKDWVLVQYFSAIELYCTIYLCLWFESEMQ